MNKIEAKVNEFKTLYPDHELIAVIQTGSHLFKLNNENSDTDITGIFMPPVKEFKKHKIDIQNRRLNKSNKYMYGQLSRLIDLSSNSTGKHNKNSKEDIDAKFYSIFDLLDRLITGEFNAMELLYAPDYAILQTSHLWSGLQDQRDNLVVFNLDSFLGFIKREYLKTGITGNTYIHTLNFYNWLKDQEGNYLKDVIHKTRELDYVQQKFTKVNNSNYTISIPSIKVGRRMYQETVRIKYLIEDLERFLSKNDPSHRKNENGIDSKGLYHCQRLVFEAQDLINQRKLQIPFSDANHKYLMDIRKNLIEYEELKNNINNAIDLLEDAEQDLPSSNNAISLLEKIKNNLYMEMEFKIYRGRNE